jgi:1,4-dihydroxy-2-naphthoate octaprenyltransferase
MATLLDNWKSVLTTQNLPEERAMDLGSKWLLIIRASVFPMTITSGAIGGLLAVAGPTPTDPQWLYFAVAMIGLVLAHAANNMINDYFDTIGGVDTASYVRGQYAPHPILSGLVSKGGLLAAIAIVNLIDLGILAWLTQERGPLVVVFALLGLFISVFYVAPPLQLKHHGWGEPGVALVWGPLMIGGTYFVTTGEIHPWVFVASLPYAILVTTVLIGKHIDKHDADKEKGIHTLPVILGVERSRFLNQFLMVSFFGLVLCLVLAGTLGVWTLAVFAAVPKLVGLLRVQGAPRPAEKPANYPLWPLWYVAWAFVFTRLCGGLFLLGLALNAIFPIFL